MKAGIINGLHFSFAVCSNTARDLSLQKTPTYRFVTEFGTLLCSPVEGEENKKKSRKEKRRKLDENKKEEKKMNRRK